MRGFNRKKKNSYSKFFRNSRTNQKARNRQSVQSVALGRPLKRHRFFILFLWSILNAEHGRTRTLFDKWKPSCDIHNSYQNKKKKGRKCARASGWRENEKRFGSGLPQEKVPPRSSSQKIKQKHVAERERFSKCFCFNFQWKWISFYLKRVFWRANFKV